LVQIAIDQVREAEHQAGAIRGEAGGPGGEGALGSNGRGIDVRGGGLGDFGDDQAGGGLDVGDVRPADGRDKLAIDEVENTLHNASLACERAAAHRVRLRLARDRQQLIEFVVRTGKPRQRPPSTGDDWVPQKATDTVRVPDVL